MVIERIGQIWWAASKESIVLVVDRRRDIPEDLYKLDFGGITGFCFDSFFGNPSNVYIGEIDG